MSGEAFAVKRGPSLSFAAEKKGTPSFRIFFRCGQEISILPIPSKTLFLARFWRHFA
jgi:hypothetical protein